jgi:hypothetical protein
MSDINDFAGRSDHPDARQSQLRALVAAVDREVTPAAPGALTAAWAALVKGLALGPEPEVRECPSCGTLGMLEATRCSHCWSPLSPGRRGDRRP